MRLLVLSDIHAGPDNKSRSLIPLDNAAERGLADDSRVQALLAIVPSLNPDAIVIPGDLTDDATVGQFSAVFEFLDAIRQAAGLPAEAVIVAPGNHDTDWSVFGKHSKNSFEFAERKHQRYWAVTHAARRARPAIPLGEQLFKDGFYEIKTFGDVQFLVLNSAAHDHPKIQPHYGEISDNTLAAIKANPFWQDKRVKLRIAILHHHLENFLAAPAIDFSALQNHAALRILLEEGEVGLVIHGHKHLARLAMVNRLIPALGCGTFGGEPFIAENSSHQVFHVVDIEPASHADKIVSKARGSVETYAWVYGRNMWAIADSNWIAGKDFFGGSGSLSERRDWIKAVLRGRQQATEFDLRSASRKLRWLPAADLRASMSSFTKHGWMYHYDPEQKTFILVKKAKP